MKVRKLILEAIQRELDYARERLEGIAGDDPAREYQAGKVMGLELAYRAAERAEEA
ncbi:MAG: hypothetical protein Q8O76_01400 [Chloroflexota bacterium]|nr:hypothetical protein [Chloroflexota bacterium]